MYVKKNRSIDRYIHRQIDTQIDRYIDKRSTDGQIDKLNKQMNLLFLQGQLPFAVVGSREEVEVGGKRVRARKYPWGTVEGIQIYKL